VAVPQQAPRREIAPAAELVARLTAQPPAPADANSPASPDTTAQHPRHDETMRLQRYSPHIDPFQPYPQAYEERYQRPAAAAPRGPFEPVRMPDPAPDNDEPQPPRSPRTPHTPHNPGEHR
ncbi:hypothetical protein ACFRKD_36380, partial [Streptomyces niveus]